MHQYNIILERRAAVESALHALAKRASRKGLPMPLWTWGKAYQTNERAPLPVTREAPPPEWKEPRVQRIPLYLDAPPARFAGWTFAATIQHTENGNIVRNVPGAEVPASFRTASSACEHCRVQRRRNDTFVVQHESARYMQVGSSCIADFLGGDDASKIASQAELLASINALCESGESGEFGGRTEPSYVLSTFLAVAAAAVRVHGWVSRSKGDFPTADCTLKALEGKLRPDQAFEVTPADESLALAAEVWAESISDETLEKERGDYLHNVRVVARGGSVTLRTAGIAASIIQAYNRNVMDQRRAEARVQASALSKYVGTPGKREAFSVKLDNITGYDTTFGYVTLLRFVTDDGSILIWKASNPPDLQPSQVGQRFKLTGSVKEHSEYKGAKQTLVQRCKVEPA